MKKKLDIRLYFLQLLFAVVALFPACKKSSENASAPVITSVRSYVASPNDTVLHSAIPTGQWVVITGQNLQNATQINFDGVPATFNAALFAPNSAVVQIPTIQFATVDTTKLNTIRYTTPGGTTTFSFKLTPGPPTITSISDENASPGDSVHIYGTFFSLIKTLTFGGTSITSFTVSGDGDIGFLMPSTSQSGPVSVTTKFGSTTTVYNVNDVATGSIASFDYGIGNYGWAYYGGANVTSGNSDFPGNLRPYAILQNNPLSPGEGNNYTSYSINIQSETWVPSANIGDPPSNWAVKFEVSVPKPWNGTTIAIRTDFNDSKYIYRWEPWQISATSTAPYTTKGWITVTIPLSLFRAKDPTLGDGEGLPLTNIADLTGAAGNNPQCYFQDSNYGSANSATGFYGAFGNIRVVKIK